MEYHSERPWIRRTRTRQEHRKEHNIPDRGMSNLKYEIKERTLYIKTKKHDELKVLTQKLLKEQESLSSSLMENESKDKQIQDQKRTVSRLYHEVDHLKYLNGELQEGIRVEG